MICKRCIVSGIVQGVFYRASTAKRAAQLGLTGWVRNQPDGSVETKICGDPAAVAEMLRWLWIGPDRARVDDIIEEDDDYESFADFIVR